MGDLVESVHVVLSGVHSAMMFGRLLQNKNMALYTGLYYCSFLQPVKYTRGTTLLEISDCGDFLFWENALSQCQGVLAAPGIPPSEFRLQKL